MKPRRRGFVPLVLLILAVSISWKGAADDVPQTPPAAPDLAGSRKQPAGSPTPPSAAPNSPDRDKVKAAAPAPVLRVSLRADDAKSAEEMRLTVTIENVGDQDTVLLMGIMLGNGISQFPMSIRLLLTGDDEKTLELEIPFPAVAGRMDPYIVPLRVGSAYSLALRLDDFRPHKSHGESIRLKPGRYRLRAEFVGESRDHLTWRREGLPLLRYWPGRERSEEATFRIGP